MYINYTHMYNEYDKVQYIIMIKFASRQDQHEPIAPDRKL